MSAHLWRQHGTQRPNVMRVDCRHISVHRALQLLVLVARHVGASAQRSAPGLPGAAAAAAAVAAAPASGAAAGRLDTIQQVPGLAMPQQCGHGPTSSLAGRAEAGGGSGGVAAGGRSPNGCRRVITWKTAAAAVGRAATRCTPPYRALQKRAAPHPAEPARSQRCRLPEPYRRSSNN